jgi:hypothetical protein
MRGFYKVGMSNIPFALSLSKGEMFMVRQAHHERKEDDSYDDDDDEEYEKEWCD